MSSRQDQEVLEIHPKVLALIGEEACMEMLAVARDLRSGVIPPEQYDQTNLDAFECGTACCIAGHLRRRCSRGVYDNIWISWVNVHGVRGEGLRHLFWSGYPSDPQLAADAIERFVFDGSDKPWKV